MPERSGTYENEENRRSPHPLSLSQRDHHAHDHTQHRRQSGQPALPQLRRLRQKLRDLTSRQETVLADLELARRDAMQLQDESTAELEESIRNVERINVMVRANLDKERAEEEAADDGRRYDALTDELAALRARRRKLWRTPKCPCRS